MYNIFMIKDKKIFSVGVFVIIVWIFFGIPTSWKIFLTIFSELYLIFLSVKINFPKKSFPKKLKKREKVTPVFSESMPPVMEDEKTVSENKSDIK